MLLSLNFTSHIFTRPYTPYVSMSADNSKLYVFALHNLPKKSYMYTYNKQCATCCGIQVLYGFNGDIAFCLCLSTCNIAVVCWTSHTIYTTRLERSDDGRDKLAVDAATIKALFKKVIYSHNREWNDALENHYMDLYCICGWSVWRMAEKSFAQLWVYWIPRKTPSIFNASKHTGCPVNLKYIHGLCTTHTAVSRAIVIYKVLLLLIKCVLLCLDVETSIRTVAKLGAAVYGNTNKIVCDVNKRPQSSGPKLKQRSRLRFFTYFCWRLVISHNSWIARTFPGLTITETDWLSVSPWRAELRSFRMISRY